MRLPRCITDIKPDPTGPDNTKRACTILLLAKKIKFFYSLSHKDLAIFVNRKIDDFRIKRASLCKGWGDYVFFVGSFFSGSFGRLLRCSRLTARTRCATARLRAAAGERFVLDRNSALKSGNWSFAASD